MKLISMTEFVIKSHNTIEDVGDSESAMYNYANFLNQHLTLGMFVPCDEDGTVLEKYKYFPCSLKYAKEINEYYKKYQQAKDKILFEGFEWNTAEFCDEPMLELESKKTYFLYDCEDKNFQDNFDTFIKTIEDLSKYDITLTPNAIKQLKL